MRLFICHEKENESGIYDVVRLAALLHGISTASMKEMSAIYTLTEKDILKHESSVYCQIADSDYIYISPHFIPYVGYIKFKWDWFNHLLKSLISYDKNGEYMFTKHKAGTARQFYFFREHHSIEWVGLEPKSVDKYFHKNHLYTMNSYEQNWAPVNINNLLEFDLNYELKNKKK